MASEPFDRAQDRLRERGNLVIRSLAGEIAALLLTARH